jgi:hypothetical protein
MGAEMTPCDNETVAERIALALKRHGVDTIVAQSLPSAVILAADAIGIRQVAYRQENMGGAMADGYARVSGRIAVVAAQNGPAATPLVPPLAEACKASIPVVALVQDAELPQVDRNAFRKLDHFGLFSSCAKWVRRILTANRADDYVDGAFVAAGSGRPGPAVLLLSADVLREHTLEPFDIVLVNTSAGKKVWPGQLCRFWLRHGPGSDALSYVTRRSGDRFRRLVLGRAAQVLWPSGSRGPATFPQIWEGLRAGRTLRTATLKSFTTLRCCRQTAFRLPVFP